MVWNTVFLLLFVSTANCLNILIVGNSPYGSINNQLLHKYLSRDTSNKIISVLPLSQYTETYSEVTIDNTNLSKEQIEYTSQIVNPDKATLENISKFSWFDNGVLTISKRLNNVSIAEMNEEDKSKWIEDMWYVKASPMGTLLYALDFLVPDQYSDVSIDLVIIGPSIGTTLGLYEQNSNNDFHMMQLCLLRNIPSINLSGADLSTLSTKTISFEDTNNMMDHESENEDLPSMIYSFTAENIVKALKLNDFGSHNFDVAKRSYESSFEPDNSFERHSYAERSNKVKRVLPNGIGLNINLPLVGSASITREVCQNPKFVQTKSHSGFNRIPVLSLDIEENKYLVEKSYSVNEDLDNTDYFQSYSGLQPKTSAATEESDLSDEKLPISSLASELSMINECYISITPVTFNGRDQLNSLKYMYRLLERLNNNNFDPQFLSEDKYYDSYEVIRSLHFEHLTEGSADSQDVLFNTKQAHQHMVAENEIAGLYNAQSETPHSNQLHVSQNGLLESLVNMVGTMLTKY